MLGQYHYVLQPGKYCSNLVALESGVKMALYDVGYDGTVCVCVNPTRMPQREIKYAQVGGGGIIRSHPCKGSGAKWPFGSCGIFPLPIKS